MFRSKKCSHCGKKVKDDWKFCPYCGNELFKPKIRKYENVFDDIESEFKKIDKMFGSDFFDFPKIDLKMPRGSSGVSITITSNTGGKPKIKVKTSGNYKHLEPEIKRKLGVKPSIEEVEEKPMRRISKVTEEPETKVKTLGNKKMIQIKLPDVEKMEDIEVKKLEQSIEVKAFAKDKTYFTLIPIPSNSFITKKEFENNVLKIEIER